MKYFLLPFRLLYILYSVTTFLVLMLIVIPFVIAASFFGRIRGGNFLFQVCSLWADIWFFLIGIRHKNIYESPHDKSKHYIFVANHISYLDGPLIVKTIRQHVRVLGKEEMIRIPIFGYIYRNVVVTVDRSSPENRAKSVRILKSILNKNISVFIFPEGTFNHGTTPLKDFFDGAFRIAIETQTPIKPVLFLNAYDRFHYSSAITLSPGRSRSIFLEEIPVEGLEYEDLPALKGSVYAVMDRKLREYKASWIKD
jgi:1-acyl-sn-glycerol-3-phosphate acyltransferase